MRRSKRRRRSPDRFSSSDDDSDGSPKASNKAKQKLANRSSCDLSTATLPQPPERMNTPHSKVTYQNNGQMTPSSKTMVSNVLPIPEQQNSPSQGGSSNTVHARDLRLFTLLEKLRSEQQEMKRVMNTILQRLDQHQPEESQAIPENVNFPLNSSHDLDELEIQLQDKNIFNCVVNHLAVYGGRNVKETVCRLLKETITNPLAECYNWHGKKGKLPFGNLKLMAVIYKCVQKNAATKTATLKDVEVIVKEWLRGARDRDGGRKRRLQATRDDTIS